MAGLGLLTAGPYHAASRSRFYGIALARPRKLFLWRRALCLRAAHVTAFTGRGRARRNVPWPVVVRPGLREECTAMRRAKPHSSVLPARTRMPLAS
eukprot:scaffold1507_cov134-Isochrysis_galbana.AAC.4